MTIKDIRPPEEVTPLLQNVADQTGRVVSQFSCRGANWRTPPVWNVRDSDGTAIMSVAAALTGGSKRTTVDRMFTPGVLAQRILVVDDDPLVCDSVRRMLAVNGHQVETATSGEQALATFEIWKFDLIITDYELHLMNGDELAAAIDHGFGVRLARSGSLYQNSQVILFEGTNALAATNCTFQFAESISLSCTIFPDGHVSGTVDGSGQEFLFEFGPQSIASVGTNFAFWTEYPATQSDCIIPPTLDNLTVSAGPVAVQASIRVSEVEVCWSSQADVLYQVDYRSDLTTNIWAPLLTNIPGTGATICVHDTVLPGASQRFYRVVAPTR